MKFKHIALMSLALAASFSSCSDYLEQEPPSSLPSDGFFTSEAKVKAAADQFYGDVLPGHANWSYGLYAGDVNTDNQINWNGDGKFATGLWKTANDNGNWSWNNIRNINYQLNSILEAQKAGKISGSEAIINQYIGEIYFMRAYCYFDMLQKWGDLPIVTEAFPDNEEILVAANKRQPCNEVARFIMEDLDKAISLMQDGFDKNHTRISPDAARLFKSRVALYEDFDMLQKWGDLPIVTEAFPDNEEILVAANKRQPCNEVARFIMEDLDKAISLMQDGFDKNHTRISPDAARLFKSRVALYEGSWLTYFAGTAFVPNGEGWPGKAKEYNANYQYPTGSVDAEAKYFLQESAKAAEMVADKYKDQLMVNTGTIPQKEGDPQNPYFNIWGTTDMSGTPEVILWRQYSKELGVVNNVEVGVQHGDFGVGLTRSMVEGYVMKDGKPIYNSAYTYSDQTIADVATNRDPRLTIFLKVPGQKNVFKNMSAPEDHYVIDEPYPTITTRNAENDYSTGYAIRKGGTFDKANTGNGNCYNAAEIFRATEALLNYMEAEYMLTNSLSGKVLEYWKDVRKAAGFTGDAVNPQVTIDATEMSKETADWGSYSAGKQLTDKILYNIRRERRCELISEGLRGMDLQRWRSYDQLMTTPAHMEGIHLWNTPMQSWYNNLNADGSSNANVSSSSLSEYYRPLEVNMTATNSYKDGFTWHMAHYLQPLPIKQFLLTASDYSSVEKSPLYQNPYWPTSAGQSAEK